MRRSDRTGPGLTALSRRLPIPAAVIWVCFIWGNSLQPAVASSARSGSITAVLAQWVPWLTEHIVRKTAHYTEYAVLGLLLAWVLYAVLREPRRHLPAVALAGLLVPLLDETIQLFVPGRSGEMRDVWLDCAGVATGLLLGAALQRGIRWYRHRAGHS